MHSSSHPHGFKGVGGCPHVRYLFDIHVRSLLGTVHRPYSHDSTTAHTRPYPNERLTRQASHHSSPSHLSTSHTTQAANLCSQPCMLIANLCSQPSILWLTYVANLIHVGWAFDTVWGKVNMHSNPSNACNTLHSIHLHPNGYLTSTACEIYLHILPELP